MKKISIIVPMYNEEKVVSLFFSAMDKVLEKLTQYSFELVIVNDGSKDGTYPLLLEEQKRRSNLVLVNLSRNFGHEPAVAAGIATATGDALIPMDADLQDPPELIKDLLEKFEEGFDVVNAKRKTRHEDTFLKRFTAIQFYKFIARLAGKVKIPQNVGHFRLISRRVADEVIRLTERNRVFRIEVPFLGFKTTEVYFDRPKRVAGETHYNLKSMVKLAVDSIASTTSVPLVWPTWIAIFWEFIVGLSIVGQVVVLIFVPIDSMVHWIWLAGNVLGVGLAFMFYVLAILALYLSRVFIETQNRPFYVIDDVKKFP
jgi:dolichol-phosphate mannosyltransferase